MSFQSKTFNSASIALEIESFYQREMVPNM